MISGHSFPGEGKVAVCSAGAGAGLAAAALAAASTTGLGRRGPRGRHMLRSGRVHGRRSVGQAAGPIFHDLVLCVQLYILHGRCCLNMLY